MMKSSFGWEYVYIYQIYEYFSDFIHEKWDLQWNIPIGFLKPQFGDFYSNHNEKWIVQYVLKFISID